MEFIITSASLPPRVAPTNQPNVPLMGIRLMMVRIRIRVKMRIMMWIRI